MKGSPGAYAVFWRRIYDAWGRWYDPFVGCVLWFIGGEAQFRQAMLRLERGLETELSQTGFLVLDRVLTNAGIMQVVVCRAAQGRER